MAHPDPNRQGSEEDQRRHVGNNTEASDLGVQDKSQGKSGRAAPERKDDPSLAPESGEKLGSQKQPVNPKPPGYQEASGGDRGEAGSQNAEQSRDVGQDDPAKGSRMGREAGKKSGDPGSPDETGQGDKREAP